MKTETAIDSRPIPDELVSQISRTFGLDAPPTTLGEWADATANLLDDADFDLDVAALCTADDARHVARIDGNARGFHCVLDPLLLPFVVDQDAFDVRSESPVSDAVVELTVSRDGVEVTPEGSVMSLGVASDATVPTDEELDPEIGYERFCPYVNAFASEAAYDRWDRVTTDGTTMAVPFSTGFELAQAIARSGPFVTE